MRNTSTFAVASLVLGILSLVTLCTGILPIPLGALGILFAALLHRKGRSMPPQATAGLVTSICGLIMGLFITVGACVYTFVEMPMLLRDPAYRQQLNETCEQMYGMSFDDLMQQAYGIDIDEWIEIQE